MSLSLSLALCMCTCRSKQNRQTFRKQANSQARFELPGFRAESGIGGSQKPLETLHSVAIASGFPHPSPRKQQQSMPPTLKTQTNLNPKP